ncbi:MAG: hypothetical protein II894_01935 [Bacteroidales bacterium]|nr:hypothetical protein [Bacteroidales bacterium]
MKKLFLLGALYIFCFSLNGVMAQNDSAKVDYRLFDKTADYVAMNFMNALIELNYRDAELYAHYSLLENTDWNRLVKWCKMDSQSDTDGSDFDLKKLREYRYINGWKLEIVYKEFTGEKVETNVIVNSRPSLDESETLLIWMNNCDSEGNGHDSGRVYLVKDMDKWKVVGYNF